jgi:uncharacterized protein YraI
MRDRSSHRFVIVKGPVMKHAALAAVTLAFAAAAAQAQTVAPVLAFTAKPVNLRAGPAREYPIVAVLPANLQVAVQGCLTDASWCDVVAGYERGWVYAGNIAYPYQDQWQPMVSLAPLIGIAILGFAFDDYWHQHYWNRPWYPDRSRWEHVRPPRYVPHPAPRPPDGWRPPPNWQPGHPGWNPAAPRRPGEHARPPGQVVPRTTVPPPAPAPAPRTMPPQPVPRAVPSPHVQPQPQPRAQPQPRQGGQRNEHERR